MDPQQQAEPKDNDQSEANKDKAEDEKGKEEQEDLTAAVEGGTTTEKEGDFLEETTAEASGRSSSPTMIWSTLQAPTVDDEEENPDAVIPKQSTFPARTLTVAGVSAAEEEIVFSTDHDDLVEEEEQQQENPDKKEDEEEQQQDKIQEEQHEEKETPPPMVPPPPLLTTATTSSGFPDATNKALYRSSSAQIAGSSAVSRVKEEYMGGIAVTAENEKISNMLSGAGAGNEGANQQRGPTNDPPGAVDSGLSNDDPPGADAQESLENAPGGHGAVAVVFATTTLDNVNTSPAAARASSTRDLDYSAAVEALRNRNTAGESSELLVNASLISMQPDPAAPEFQSRMVDEIRTQVMQSMVMVDGQLLAEEPEDVDADEERALEQQHGSGPTSSSSSTMGQPRHFKIGILAALLAVVLAVALTVGLVVSNNNDGGGDDSTTLLAGQDGDTPTISPSMAPITGEPTVAPTTFASQYQLGTLGTQCLPGLIIISPEECRDAGVALGGVLLSTGQVFFANNTASAFSFALPCGCSMYPFEPPSPTLPSYPLIHFDDGFTHSKCINRFSGNYTYKSFGNVTRPICRRSPQYELRRAGQTCPRGLTITSPEECLTAGITSGAFVGNGNLEVSSTLVLESRTNTPCGCSISLGEKSLREGGYEVVRIVNFDPDFDNCPPDQFATNKFPPVCRTSPLYQLHNPGETCGDGLEITSKEMCQEAGLAFDGALHPLEGVLASSGLSDQVPCGCSIRPIDDEGTPPYIFFENDVTSCAPSGNPQNYPLLCLLYQPPAQAPAPTIPPTVTPQQPAAAPPTSDASPSPVVKQYQAMDPGTSCPYGLHIVSEEECLRAGLAVGGTLQDGNILAGSWSNQPCGCSIQVHIPGNPLIMFDTDFTSCTPKRDLQNNAPICYESSEYELGERGTSCPVGSRITSLEECKRAGVSFGGATLVGEIPVGDGSDPWLDVPCGCSVQDFGKLLIQFDPDFANCEIEPEEGRDYPPPLCRRYPQYEFLSTGESCAFGLHITSQDECELAGQNMGGILNPTEGGVVVGAWSFEPCGCSIQPDGTPYIYFDTDFSDCSPSEGSQNFPPVCRLSPKYQLLDAGETCPDGYRITSQEECQTAGLLLGGTLQSDAVVVGSWDNQPCGCSLSPVVHFDEDFASCIPAEDQTTNQPVCLAMPQNQSDAVVVLPTAPRSSEYELQLNGASCRYRYHVTNLEECRKAGLALGGILDPVTQDVLIGSWDYEPCACSIQPFETGSPVIHFDITYTSFPCPPEFDGRTNIPVCLKAPRYEMLFNPFQRCSREAQIRTSQQCLEAGISLGGMLNGEAKVNVGSWSKLPCGCSMQSFQSGTPFIHFNTDFTGSCVEPIGPDDDTNFHPVCLTDSSFLVSHTKMSQGDCVTYCQANNARLPCIANDDMNDEIKRIGLEFWLGYSDQSTEGQFEWMDAECDSTYTNWLPLQPSGGPNEHCAVMTADFSFSQWIDTDCDNPNSFYCLCQID